MLVAPVTSYCILILNNGIGVAAGIIPKLRTTNAALEASHVLVAEKLSGNVKPVEVLQILLGPLRVLFRPLSCHGSLKQFEPLVLNGAHVHTSIIFISSW